jgi:outer membrane lipoprotein-sorting protein
MKLTTFPQWFSHVYTLLLAAIMLVVFVPSAWGLSPDTTDPKAIMDAVDNQPKSNKSTARMEMTIADASGASRVRAVQTRSMVFPEGTRQLILFESPADVRNTGLLTVDYDDGEKVDDQWLYLPSLRKSTRIASSAKSGSFMGSDLSFADMTRQDPNQYSYSIVKQSAKVGGDDCWKIEARPQTAKAIEETGYVKSHVWVSKDKLAPVQAKNWIREGKKIKLIKFGQLKKIGEVWVPHKISARTMQNGKPVSTTVLAFSGVTQDNPDVKESDFTQRRLEQGL